MTTNANHHDHAPRPSGHRNPDDEGLFLGKNTKSRWTDWSKDRRQDTERRLSEIRRRDEEEREMMNGDPIEKANRESAVFHEPKGEEDDEMIIGTFETPEEQAKPPPSPPKRRKVQTAQTQEKVRLTINQWEAVVSYWDHRLFVRFRLFALIFGIFAITLGVISVSSDLWIHPTVSDESATKKTLSIFKNCTVGENQDCDHFKSFDAYLVVTIGFLLFSLVFGTLGFGLATTGLCVTTLPKKLYYFHSSGEIFLVSGFTGLLGMLTYYVCTSFIEDYKISGSYGIGFYLGGGMFILFYLAAFCMCFDEIFMTFVKLRGATKK